MAEKREKDNRDKDNVVVSAAKAIGKAAGKVASLTGNGAEEQPAGDATATPSSAESRRSAKGKLPKKNKDRLPRRLKKAQKKKLQTTS